MESLRNGLVNILLVAMCFEAYFFVKISGFAVTPVIIIIALIFPLTLMTLDSLWISMSKTNVILFIFIIYVCINFIIAQNSDIKSFLLFLFFTTAYILSYRRVEECVFNRFIEVFNKFMLTMSVYAIYQFIARIYQLPFGDIIIPAHMVPGYNWTNEIVIGGQYFWRSNGIFLEPSFLSQFIALPIAFTLFDIKQMTMKAMIPLMVKGISLLLTFSGTGILLMFFFLLMYLFTKEVNAKTKMSMIALGLAAMMIVICVVDMGPIFSFFSERLTEVTKNRMSGGLRFSGPFRLLKVAMHLKPLTGFGLGSREWFKMNYGGLINVLQTIDLTLPRIGIEIGIVGIVLFTAFLISSINPVSFRNKYYRILVVFIFIQLFNSEMFLSTMYWPFLIFMNCEITGILYSVKTSHQIGYPHGCRTPVKKTQLSESY